VLQKERQAEHLEALSRDAAVRAAERRAEMDAAADGWAMRRRDGMVRAAAERLPTAKWSALGTDGNASGGCRLYAAAGPSVAERELLLEPPSAGMAAAALDANDAAAPEADDAASPEADDVAAPEADCERSTDPDHALVLAPTTTGRDSAAEDALANQEGGIGEVSDLDAVDGHRPAVEPAPGLAPPSALFDRAAEGDAISTAPRAACASLNISHALLRPKGPRPTWAGQAFVDVRYV